MHSIGMQIDRTPFEAPLTGVRGWLSPEERRTLYGLALYTEGRVLEIGPWLGLSTACLAYGIRDRGVPRAFVTADLNPRPEFYHRLGDKVGFKLPGDDAYRNVSSYAGYLRDVAPVLRRPGRAIGLLRQNLTRLELIHLVTILEGDFANAPDLGYGLIFCDATHSPYEISKTVPSLLRYLHPGTILACHDIDEVNRESLARYVSFGDSFQSDSLFVGEVKGPAPGVDRGGFSRVQGETQEVATHRLPGDHVHTHGRAPEVSVVLRTYNRSHLLSRAILSVLDQDYTDFELLIVDDGSTDGTDALVRRFADPRIRYIRSPRNQGLGAARNLGIRESRGKYVAFLDSDDEWLPSKLSQQVDTLRQAPEDVGVVYSRYWHVQHGRARLSPPPLRQFAGNFEAPVRRLEGDVYRALLRGNFAPAQAALVRASCFERVGPADASLPAYEDWDLWLRIARHFRFVYQKTPLLYVYHTDDSISTKAERLATGLQSLAAKHESDPVAYRCLQAQYHNMMGKIKCREGLTGAARQHFVRAIRWRPSTMAFYLSTALTLLGAGAYTRLAHRLGI